ncbi:MAG TPA: hypothetical protein VF627_02880, partial [Abditibacterium sp.]
MFLSSSKIALIGSLSMFLLGRVALAQSSTPLSYTGGTLPTQNFNTLASSGTGSALPEGFAFVESGSGANATYAAGTGADNPGNTYSFGAAGSSERALGGLQSGSVIPTFGVFIRNDSGTTITQFTVSYQGEQYRLGVARNGGTTGTADRLDFAYSTNATTLNATSGFTEVDALDFVSPITSGTAGAVYAATPISATVTGVSIAPGAVLVLRFSDFNVDSSDD